MGLNELVCACLRDAPPEEVADVAQRVAARDGAAALNAVFDERDDGTWGPPPRHLRWTPAIMKRHGGLALRLLELGAAAETESGGSPGHANTPLLRASMFGAELRADVVGALISRGANVDGKNDNGTTCLMFAIERGHLEVARQLLGAGCDARVRETCGGRTAALIRAAAGVSAAQLPFPDGEEEEGEEGDEEEEEGGRERVE